MATLEGALPYLAYIFDIFIMVQYHGAALANMYLSIVESSRRGRRCRLRLD